MSLVYPLVLLVLIVVINAKARKQQGGIIVVHEFDEAQAKVLQLLSVNQDYQR